MPDLLMCLLFIICGLCFAAVGLVLFMQCRERLASEKPTRGTFWHFHICFGGFLGIGDILLGLISFIFAICIAIN